MDSYKKELKVRRFPIVLTLLCALVGATALTSPAALAAHPSSGRPSASGLTAAPPGWHRVTGALPMARRKPADGKLGGIAAAQPEGVSIRFLTNPLFVRTETGYPDPDRAMLRAASSTVNGARERYDLFFEDETGYYLLGSRANFRYVTTETGLTGSRSAMLRAGSVNGDTVRERYVLWRDDRLDSWALQSVANGRFVVTETDYTGSLYGMLRARASGIVPDSEFELCDLGGLCN